MSNIYSSVCAGITNSPCTSDRQVSSWVCQQKQRLLTNHREQK